MKKSIYFGFACILLLGCEAVTIQENSLMKKVLAESSVEFLNDTYYELEATSSGGFELSMKVNIDPSTAYKINYAAFRISETGTSLNEPVGGESIESDDFDSQNVFTKSYKIYRGGNFQIVAEVDLVDSITNTPSTIYSEPMTLKVKYPSAEAIESEMASEFTTTWNTSKVDPNRYEYGYYIFLKDNQMEKGTLIKGSANPCDSQINTVLLSDSETSMSANPTTTGAADNKYFIAKFHTHPSLSTCSPMYQRDVGPSSIDVGEPNSNPYLPSFVYDYEEPLIGWHDVNAPARVYCYADEGRSPWD